MTQSQKTYLPFYTLYCLVVSSVLKAKSKWKRERKKKKNPQPRTVKDTSSDKSIWHSALLDLIHIKQKEGE